MSEATPSAAPDLQQCPLPLSALPANFQKHVDPKAPPPLRMMGAKAMVPMGPKEMVTALFMLGYDPEQNVRDTATKSAGGLPDRILSVALRDETVDAPVLDWFAGLLAGKDVYLEMLVLNAATPDTTVQRVAATGDEKIVEIIAQNQLRLLRHADIVRSLCGNPNARASTVDNVCDFCVRSGLALDDLPQFRAAKKRILGVDDDAKAEAIAAQQRADESRAESELEKMAAHVDTPDGPQAAPGSMEAAKAAEAEAEQKRLSITQQVMKLSIAKKIEWANKKGNKEVRTILLRDPSKLVQLAVIQSPRITENEIAQVALSRTAPVDVLSYIYNNRMLLKNYTIKVNLVNNPKVPVAVSMRFLSTLRGAEVKAIAKSKNVPQGLATAARKLLEKKGMDN
jgi:hypothetical protein